MKNKILVTAGLSVLLSVALYAHGGYGSMGPGMMDNDNDQNQQQYNQNMKYNGYGMMNGNYPGMMNNGYGMMGGYGMMHGNYPGMMNNGYGMMGGYGMMNGNYPGMMNNGYGMGMMGGFHHFGYGNDVMHMVYRLNLTRDQLEKISKIQMDMYTKIQTTDSAFTKNSFNKDEYIKIMKNRKDNLIKTRAETIEKIYNILTSKQKEDLKSLMDFMNSRKF